MYGNECTSFPSSQPICIVIAFFKKIQQIIHFETKTPQEYIVLIFFMLATSPNVMYLCVLFLPVMLFYHFCPIWCISLYFLLIEKERPSLTFKSFSFLLKREEKTQTSRCVGYRLTNKAVLMANEVKSSTSPQSTEIVPV